MVPVTFLGSLIFLLTSAVSGADYNYDNPFEWTLTYPECAGNRQSPIALYSKKSIPTMLYPITFHNYKIPIAHPIEVTNNGKTVSIPIGKTIKDTIPAISGGGLDSRYEVQELHYHWGGPPRNPGSEHTIDGKQYDLEMHIVHKNIKYATLDEATNNSDGLAVLGILFKAVKDSYYNSSGIQEIYDVLPSLTWADSRQELTRPISMRSFLNDLKPRKYFTYPGSLTTPPCSEAVTWFVFTDIVPIELKYLKRFWALCDSNGAPLLNNYRPVQPSRNRKVYLSKSYYAKTDTDLFGQ